MNYWKDFFSPTSQIIGMNSPGNKNCLNQIVEKLKNFQIDYLKKKHR